MLLEILVAFLTIGAIWIFVRIRFPKDGLDHIPYAPGLHWLLGHVIHAKNLQSFFLESFKQPGLEDVFLFHALWIRTPTTSDPVTTRKMLLQSVQRFGPDFNREILGDNILIMDEAKWRPERKRLNEFFSFLAVNKMVPAMNESAQELSQQLTSFNGEYVKLSALMARVTLDVLMRTIFSHSLSNISNVDELFDAVNSFNESFVLAGVFSSLPIIGSILPNKHIYRYKKAKAFLEAFAWKKIHERQQQREKGEAVPSDLLSELAFGQSEGEINLQLSLDHALILIFAGQDTTANALTFALWLLAQHPDALARAVEEADQVLAEDVVITADTLAQLTYIDKVAKEALRLYPPVQRVSRVLKEPLQAGPHTIPSGAFVYSSVAGLHRRPDQWERPDEFYPEHFDTDKVEARDGGAFLPFGGGARGCIGMRMSQLEQKLILATILKNFTLKLQPGQNIKLVSGITLHPDPDIMIAFVPRVK